MAMTEERREASELICVTAIKARKKFMNISG
jgi:hypothetical protein